MLKVENSFPPANHPPAWQTHRRGDALAADPTTMGGASTGLSRLVPTHIGPARFVPTVYPRKATRSVDASVASARSTTTIRRHRLHHHSTRRGQASTSARLQSAAEVCWVDPTPIRPTRRPHLLAGDATRRHRDAPSGRASLGLPSPTTSLCATLMSTWQGQPST